MSYRTASFWLETLVCFAIVLRTKTCRLTVGLAQGLPFEDGSFDFVQMRTVPSVSSGPQIQIFSG
jgi:hypothetical protein